MAKEKEVVKESAKVGEVKLENKNKKEEVKMEKKVNKKKDENNKEVKKMEKAIITVKHLEEEFGMKAKVIRRHLRAMEENSKPRGPEQYQWWEDSKELAAIKKNLKAQKQKKQPR